MPKKSWVSTYSKSVTSQLRSDLYMKAWVFDFALGALGAGAFGLIET